MEVIRNNLEAVTKALVRAQVFNKIPGRNKVIFAAAKAIALRDSESKSYLRGVLNASTHIKRRAGMVDILRKILRSL